MDKKKLKRIIFLTFLPAISFLLLVIGATATFTAQKQMLVGGKMEEAREKERYGAGAIADFIDIALKEVGTIGGEKYRAWYTGASDGEPWCATFVSWCANEAGLLDTVIPKFQGCAAGAAWFEEKGLLKYPEEYGTPKAGDLIFLSWGYEEAADLSDIDHVGIVKEVTDGVVYTIEGNTGNMVGENMFPLTSASIYAYATPIYSSRLLAGDNNCEKVFNRLVEYGFTEEAAAGVAGNLMWESGGGPDDIALNATESNGEGVGMVQWSFGRKKDFLNYCEERGVGWPNEDIGVQCDFMILEFESGVWVWPSYGYKYGEDCNITFEAFKQCTDVGLAARVFCAKFEAPYYEHSAIDTRIEYARSVYESYRK